MLPTRLPPLGLRNHIFMRDRTFPHGRKKYCFMNTPIRMSMNLPIPPELKNRNRNRHEETSRSSRSFFQARTKTERARTRKVLPTEMVTAEVRLYKAPISPKMFFPYHPVRSWKPMSVSIHIAFTFVQHKDVVGDICFPLSDNVIDILVASWYLLLLEMMRVVIVDFCSAAACSYLCCWKS